MKKYLYIYIYHFLLTFRDALQRKEFQNDVDRSDQLVPLNQICRNTFHTVLPSSNNSIVDEISEQNDIFPSSTQNTFISIFESPKAAQINGDVRLSIHRAHREFNVEETMIDKEDVKRKMSVISMNMKYLLNKQKNIKKQSPERNQNSTQVKEIDQLSNSSSEEITTEEENHSEIMNALPNLPR